MTHAPDQPPLFDPAAAGPTTLDLETTMNDDPQTTTGFRTAPPEITPVATAWQAWWEDHDMWDGDMLYADLDTAKHHSAVAYVGEEYAWMPGDDPEDEAPSTVLAWELKYGRWRLLDGGQDTGVRLGETRTYAASAVPVAAPPTEQAAEELAKHVTRAIFALKSPAPPGSQHYRSGWDDGLEASMDAARDALLRRLAAETPQPETQAEDLAAGLPLVQGNCPACRRAELFLGTGGYPTCSNADCPEPDAATTVLEQYANEAHEPEHTWAAELHDPLADEWVPGTRYIDRDRAVNALNHSKRLGPAWKDGTPTERRLVRATTTYTVEPDTAPAVVQADGEA